MRWFKICDSIVNEKSDFVYETTVLTGDLFYLRHIENIYVSLLFYLFVFQAKIRT